MGIVPLTANELFNWNNIIIIGWLALIFAPFRKLSKYFILLPALFLSIIYSLILFKTVFLREKNSPPLDFFHLSGWMTLLKDPSMIVGTTSHFCIMDLWVGKWIVYDFYSKYTYGYSITRNSNGTYAINKSWTYQRILFTIILLLSYMVALLGFLVYNIAKYSFLKKYKTQHRIDVENEQGYIERIGINQQHSDLLNPHSVRFGDKLPSPLRKIYHFIIGIFGLIVLFTLVLPAYIGLVIYCRIIYRKSSSSSSIHQSDIVPNKLIPEFVRNVTANMKFTSFTTPINKRNWFWYLKFLLLQIATFIEYIPNSFNPHVLFQSLEDYFTKIYDVPYYAFGDGIGINSYDLLKRYLQDIPPRKDFESLGWKVSSSQATFCDFTTIFLSSDNPDMTLGRQIIFKWLHAFPYNLHKTNYQAQLYLSRIVPRKTDEKPDDILVYQAIGEVMFFLATGGELTKNERTAYVDCVKNPLIFFPNWFNFLLGGHYFERKTLGSYYTILQAFSRYVDGPALQAAFNAADNKKSKSEILKLVAIVFSIAGSAAPAKLAVSVIEKLWSKNEKEKEKNILLFQKNPHNFIKEVARLDKAVPMVNVLATSEIANEIENNFKNKNSNIKIYENTPLHCSIVNANRDKEMFKNPDDFIPDRTEINKIIVWNGVEEDILNMDEAKRPVRYCPGHDLSIDVIKYVTERFLPVVYDSTNSSARQQERIEETNKFYTNVVLSNGDHKHEEDDNILKKTNDNRIISSIKQPTDDMSDENETKFALFNSSFNQLSDDQRYYDVLDNYTKVVIELMKVAVKDSNLSPPRGIDIIPPFNLPAQDLHLLRIDMAKFIPSWDEDEPNGSSLKRNFARWLVNQNIWDFKDSLDEFDTPEQAIAWRLKMFSALPLPNVFYKEMSSDDMMTQLAFSGCACHHTQRVYKPWEPGHGIPDSKLLKDAVYVNDMTGLSMFRVRQPFERYGAAAYFDSNYKIIGIYWSHGSRLVKPNDRFWEHAKYVWRSTFFAYVTIRDHLIVTHMIECNAFVSASRQHLPFDHPLRIFIKPFTYHTVTINYQAALSLVNNRGLVHRIWAFDYDEFLKVCDYISMNYKFRLLPDFIDKSMDADNNNKTKDEWDKIYPIHRDLNEFWNIIHKYVENFFEINYNLSINDDNDNLPDDLYITKFIQEICKQIGIAGITSLKYFIDVLSQLIASSTGIHEHVGQVSGYMIDPRFIGAKLQEGKEMQNIQTYTQILSLTVITGLRMPGILEDWSHLIDHDEHYHKNLKNYQDFKYQLQKLSEDIDSRNKIRNYPFESFNPKYIECSTSI
ncbi:unnamed protein product [Didymodactylos carnosus]|uniref:Lipoxygenase domain-containing protein n=1 Tax=Didymodactylos carnosus TaxID=1234261 RepID=A0A8S2E9K1_9BILA|nr:unnamed protein product [Didymodactylos carnosus]CAF3866236.1 unnamed protein product [Didymodactylos carnosus]